MFPSCGVPPPQPADALTDDNAVGATTPDLEHIRAERIKRLTKLPIKALAPRRTEWLPLPNKPDGRYIPLPAPPRPANRPHKALMAAPTLATDPEPITLDTQFSMYTFRCISEETARRKGFGDGCFGREIKGINARRNGYPLFGCEIKVGDVIFKNCYVVQNDQAPPDTIMLSRDDSMNWRVKLISGA